MKVGLESGEALEIVGSGCPILCQSQSNVSFGLCVPTMLSAKQTDRLSVVGASLSSKC
jgi:hypothetical protein